MKPESMTTNIYMKLMEGARKIIRFMPDKGNSDLLQMAVAFVGGMALTAAVVFTPAAVDALSTGPDQEITVPTPPESPHPSNSGSNPDNGGPAVPYIDELVYTAADDASLNG